MNNDLTHKEEQFRDAAQGMSFDLDLDGLWAEVEPLLPPEESERRPIWWIFAGIAALSILFLSALYMYTSESEPKVEEAGIRTETNIPIAQNEGQSEGQNDINQSPKATSDIVIPITSKPENSIAAKEKSQIVNKLTSNSNTNTNSKLDLSSTLEDQLTINQSNTPIANTSSSILNTSDKISSQKIENINRTRSNILNLNSKLNGEPILAKRQLLASIHSLPVLTGIVNATSPKLNIAQPQITPTKEVHWRTYIGFSSGINKNLSSITTRTTEPKDLAQFDREQSMLGISNVLYFGRESNTGWRIFTALNHTRLTNRYINKETDTQQNIITGISSSSIDAEGNRINTEGDLLETIITQHDIKWHRTHEYVNLQLGIGKRILKMNNFSLITDLRAGYNILSSHSGYYFQEGETDIVTFNNSGSHPYKNQGINLGVQLGMEYSVGRYSLALTPFLEKSIGSTIESTHFYQLKNSHYGIQLGIVYRP